MFLTEEEILGTSAALILGAAIELDSTVGKGTIVTVRFPMEKK